MMQPNDLPLVCLPTDLSDEAAAKLVAFLYELTEPLERHYYPQLHRYYHPNDIRQCDPDPPSRKPIRRFDPFRQRRT